MRHLLPTVALALALTGCAVNPVTGDRELGMVSEAQEIQIGQQQYGPGRQSQGGDYVTDPKVTEYVRQVGMKLAAVADRKLPYEFVVINDSTLNAWALPGGKLAINRGLLMELGNEAELAAVLGHEIVHAAARHGAAQMEKGQLMQIGSVIASVVADAYGGNTLGGIVGQGSAIGAQAVSAKFGRDDELEADHYGMKYMKAAGYDLQAAVSLQELFVRKFEAGKEQDWMTGLFASHPPSPERVAANRKTMASLGGPGGDTGQDRYLAAMGELKKHAPAYAKYDEAMAAAGKKDLASARRLVNEAIKLEPRESRFYGFLGELEMADKDFKGALGQFTKANQLDPGYFKPMVGMGVANYQLDNPAAAEPLLESSMKAMPTVPGAYYLARVYEDKGNKDEAVKLYKAVAQTKSPLSRDAMARLGKLDLAQNPESYLSIQPQLDKQGRVWLTVGNRTSVAVTDVSIVVAVVHSSGQAVAGPERVGTGSDSIPGGKSVNLQTPLGPFTSSSVLSAVRWQVESARVVQ
jgi:beta-barrel assembly-enhancing protease